MSSGWGIVIGVSSFTAPPRGNGAGWWERGRLSDEEPLVPLSRRGVLLDLIRDPSVDVLTTEPDVPTNAEPARAFAPSAPAVNRRDRDPEQVSDFLGRQQ